MRFAQYFASFAVLTLALSVSAFARDNHSGTFTLPDTVRVGSTQLKPGQYKAEWSGPANAVKVDILQNGKTVATVQGQVKDLTQRSPYDAVTMKTLGNNTKALDEIQFNDRTQALVLGGE
ncbi:MAG: hypothetical protein WAM69_02380 [Candidatus Sulfotelmatobacter sp.]